ncbi:sensor histidine kinase [Streptacidiphilus pinicola]|uniref:histidine kinase n=1 Tax=Streptacidiphilus pinicola TaxID=2219663 RepID=A0A2X0K6B4_9ACTN|nr:sensor histidine kinase [Streptacidiphilus pinicola]
MDSALAVGLLAVTVLLGSQGGESAAPWRALDVPGDVLTTLTVLPVAARRRAPLSVLGACCGAWIVLIAAGYWPVVGSYGPMLALYSLVAARGWAGATAGAPPLGAVWVFGGLRAPHTGTGLEAIVAQAVVVPTVLAMFGLQAYRLAQRNRQLAHLTAQLAQEQAARARHAVTTERLRIARELHDVIAHHLSVVSVQTGLASYVFDSDPATARGALQTIADASGEALEETRTLLHLLRTGADSGTDPQAPDGASPRTTSPARSGPATPAPRPVPALSRIVELVDRMGTVGVDAELTVTGRERPLAQRVELSAYRIVQEALTNTLKHAGPTRAQIALHYGTEELTGRITDHGSTTAAADAPPGGRTEIPGSGNGLIGMQERVRMLGGTVRAEPRAHGGFEVVFTLPAIPGQAEAAS